MAHGFLATAGISLLAYAGLTDRIGGSAIAGLILLGVAVASGVLMNLGYHLAAKLFSTWLLYPHIGLTAAGQHSLPGVLGQPDCNFMSENLRH